jgi:integrase
LKLATQKATLRIPWFERLFLGKPAGASGSLSQQVTQSRTARVNRYIETVCFLHFLGIDHKRLIPEAERPAPVDEEPEAYTETELAQFFFVIENERHHLFFTFLRWIGAREREASHLEWSNLNLGVAPTVTFRNQGGFKTKTRRFRCIPLDPELAAELRVWQAKHGSERYVFGRADGTKVEGHYWTKCKEYAEAAALDPERFWLHKFRDTAITTWLRRGVDLRTCQQWAGHASITQTERYLAPQEQEVQQTLMTNVRREQPQAAHASATS